MKLTAELLLALTLKKAPFRWKGVCPACGYPGALSLTITKSQKLLAHCFNGCDKATLYSVLNDFAGTNWIVPKPPDPADLTAQQSKQRERALKLWAESEPLAGTKGETYLAYRNILHLVDSKALRFHGEASHPTAGTPLPAIVALVVDVSGSPLGVHRTYPAPDGHGKAAVDPQKASLGPVSGGAVRLIELDSNKPLVLSEGIETATSAGLMMNAPAWAAVNAGNLGTTLVLPSEATKLIIAVDPDLPGRSAARAAAQRWRHEGRQVTLALPHGLNDFNDLLCASQKDATNG